MLLLVALVVGFVSGLVVDFQPVETKTVVSVGRPTNFITITKTFPKPGLQMNNLPKFHLFNQTIDGNQLNVFQSMT